ncbi:hypothetical protein, partial [uncultured Mailhella sp.]|uniref:hypothetical protein n=1 Tax=uncultured Mailhella sp. TaxID=1981031 RepID=UPI00261BEA80
MPFYTVIPQVEKEHESAFSLEHHAVPSPAPASRPEQPQSVSFGRYLETSLEDGWQSGALMTLRHEARLNDARFGGEQISDLVELAEKGGLTGLDDLPALEVQGELSLEEQRERIRGAGLEGVLEPQAGYNRAALELDIERSRAIQERAGILAGAPAWMAPFGTAVRMGASMADPIELAVSFIPVIGQQRYLRMLGQMGGAWGRAAVRAGVGAVEGAVGAALLEPLIFADRSRTVPGYGALDAVENIIFGAGTGALAHAGLGALGEGKRFLFDQRHPWEVKPPTEESEALRRDFEERLFSAGQEAGAEITREQARAASVLFDARARTWAWDNGKETAEFYRLYAPDMQSGKTAGKMDTGEDPGLSAGEPLVRAGIRRKPDSAAARVVSIPADAVPEFARMKDFALWVKALLAEGGDITIDSTRQT